MSIEAANPYINATVTASAGSGKTFMLVTRILRLLLEGVEPGNILALTFTRKAAAEMQQRLSERLYQMASISDDALCKILDEMGLDKHYQNKARSLYESHQYCDYPVRTQTFHSFCQDILSQFPLEANIPPNFDLLEAADLFIQQASDALFNEAALDMQGELAQHLEKLMGLTDGLFNLHKVLHSFLQHRSDWWAYTAGQTNKTEFASQQLAKHLNFQADNQPLAQFFNSALVNNLKQFSPLLVKATGKKNLQSADIIANWLVECESKSADFKRIKNCFLTQKNEALSAGRKDSAALRKRLGDDEADIFLELHQQISGQIIETLDELNKQHCWNLNIHWYFCGERFIEYYQTIKTQQRLLDFTDLEWKTYQLLQNSDNALWIQYKLDQQIQHLLIDEFQDTNPTQWQLILPLLEEMAAAEPEPHRSIFLVGDEKQSIYSFRRAKPELQQQAADWLANNLNAKAFPMNKSWRSSPAIINTVNAVFSQDEFLRSLPSFQPHETHHHSLAGRVEVLPLCLAAEYKQDIETVYCRNPLQQARAENASIYHKEAAQIAQHIKQLINDKTAITQGATSTAVTYDDIFILVRKRAHVEDYENALRDAGIPYLGTNKGTFLSCLEIQDMEALINTLLTPFNNLALAQVLKSPLFSASDDDLQLIASQDSQLHWFDRLTDLSAQLETSHPLHRAYIYLHQWRKLTDKIPVHDLLDKIFSEADLLERYRLSTPPSLQTRVQANLTLFLEMALDLDNGRYPSLMHFMYYLRSLKATTSDSPNEAAVETREARVRIMTIHASKGLEAAVVYLADMINSDKDKSSLGTLVDWPVENKKPSHFQLIPSSKNLDSVSEKFKTQQKENQQKEDANLLYVAITRARQYLFVSACMAEKGPYKNWYQPLFKALQTLTQNEDDDHLVYNAGDLTKEQPPITTVVPTLKQADIEITPELFNKLNHLSNKTPALSPSQLDKGDENIEIDDDAQQRGTIIHLMLELMNKGQTDERILSNIKNKYPLITINEVDAWLNIAKSNFSHHKLSFIFSPKQAEKTFNECSVQYMKNNYAVFGLIDRLVIHNDKILIIDYKTHINANKNNLNQLAKNYHQQMKSYADGVRQMWPEKAIEVYLLFTECAESIKIDI